MYSYMKGATFFPPPTDFRNGPQLHSGTEGAPSFKEAGYEWLYECLPILAFDGIRPSAKTASVCLNNMCFAVDGTIKKISPSLLRWLAACYDIVDCLDKVLPADHSSMQANADRIYKSSFPLKRYSTALPRHDPKVLKAVCRGTNSFTCQSSYHQKSFDDAEMIKDSAMFLGRNVCKTCYRKMFINSPVGWHSFSDMQRITQKKFYRDILEPIQNQPLHFILISCVLEQDGKFRASELIRRGKLLVTSLGLQAFSQCFKRTFTLKFAKCLQDPRVAYEVSQMKKSQAPNKDGEFQSFFKKTIAAGTLIKQGWVQDIEGNTERIHTKMGCVVNTTSNKQAAFNADHYLVLVIMSHSTRYFLSRGCFGVMQRIIHNYPPIEISIDLRVPGNCESFNDHYTGRLHLIPPETQSITLCKAEELTYEDIYYALCQSQCSKLTLRGSYYESKQRTKNRYMPCFSEIVDLLHEMNQIQLGDIVTHSTTPKGCKIKFVEPGMLHFAHVDGISKDIDRERVLFGTVCWPPHKAESSQPLPPSWRAIPHPQSGHGIPATAVDSRADRLLKSATKKRLPGDSVRLQTSGDKKSNKRASKSPTPPASQQPSPVKKRRTQIS